MTKPGNTPLHFLAELKRRKVYRVAAAYILVTFLTLQVVDLLIPATTLPEWVDSFLLAIAITGFPIAVIAAWTLFPEHRSRLLKPLSKHYQPSQRHLVRVGFCEQKYSK